MIGKDKRRNKNSKCKRTYTWKKKKNKFVIIFKLFLFEHETLLNKLVYIYMSIKFFYHFHEYVIASEQRCSFPSKNLQPKKINISTTNRFRIMKNKYTYKFIAKNKQANKCQMLMS